MGLVLLSSYSASSETIPRGVILALTWIAMFPLTAAANEQPATAMGEVVDKTLVAWVSPANRTQKSASVLTLDDQLGHFDGIVSATCAGEMDGGK